MADMSGNGMYDNAHKYYYREDDNEHRYATKGVAGTALGIGIGALALTLLGRNGLNNLLNNGECVSNNNNGCGVTCSQRLDDTKEFQKEMFGLYKNQIDADFALYKGYRDAIDGVTAKNNNDAFSLYKYSRDSYDILKSELDALKQQVAVNEAVEPWKTKAVYDAIALERERRECADCNIVGYTNCTFIPQYIADMTPAATSTQKATRNPLCCGCNH